MADFLDCWDQYWSRGESASGFVNEVCSWGEVPTKYIPTLAAACTLKTARKATNAMLETTAPPP